MSELIPDLYWAGYQKEGCWVGAWSLELAAPWPGREGEGLETQLTSRADATKPP